MLGITSCGLSLLLVLVLAPRGISLGTLVSLSPQKPIFANSNLNWRVNVLPVSVIHILDYIMSIPDCNCSIFYLVGVYVILSGSILTGVCLFTDL